MKTIAKTNSARVHVNGAPKGFNGTMSDDVRKQLDILFASANAALQQWLAEHTAVAKSVLEKDGLPWAY